MGAMAVGRLEFGRAGWQYVGSVVEIFMRYGAYQSLWAACQRDAGCVRCSGTYRKRGDRGRSFLCGGVSAGPMATSL